MFPRSYLLNLMPENYFTERETVAGGSITFTTPLPYASAQLTRFVIDERLLIASNKAMAWVAVTAVTEHDDHMEYEADVLSGRPGTFDPRTTIISYGLPGEGYIIHHTNEGRSYVDVSRHEGRPWKEDDITNILRMGWLGGVGLEAPTTSWLGPMASSGALLNPSLDFESTEYGLAIGPNYAGGPWSVFSDIRHHSYRSSHNWATVDKETGGVDADASGNELAWWIGAKSDPCFWLTAEGVCGTTLLGDGGGGNTPSTLAFLLGPNTPRTSTQWKSAQGHVAELSGAFRLGQGPFPSTQSLTVLEDDDNLVENPVFENNVTDYWTGVTRGTATQVSTNPRWGTKCCKLTSTDSAGLAFRKVTALASPSEGDLVTWSIYVRGAGDTLGKDVWLFVSEKGATNAFQSGDVVTMTSEWQRVAVTHEVSQSGVTGLNIKVLGPPGSVGEYFFVDGANFTETDYPVPHIDGEREGCSWSGTAHNSVSGVTAATVVDLDDDVDVINSHPQLSIGMWVQMPCASDQGSAELLLMDAYSTAAAMDRFKIFFKCVGAGHYWGVYCQGGERLVTSVSERLSAGGFNAGDQVFVVLTIDFDEGDAHFYMNGSSYGTFSGALQRFAYTIWRLGGNFNGREQRGLGIGEVSVYHRILTPAEVAEFSRQQQPMTSSTQDVQEGVTYGGGGLINVPRGTVYGGQDACANIISPGANYNTVIGHGAMYYNETGDGNCVYGYQAGYGVSGESYSESVLIGYQAGHSLKNIYGQVMIGYQAGYGFDGDQDGNNWYNTFIGYQAAYTYGGYYNTVIGARAGYTLSGLASENVIIGGFAAYSATDLGTSTIVGDSAGGNLLDEYGCTFIGYAAGGYSGYDSGLAVENTYLGAYAGNYNSGYENVCVGYDAGAGYPGDSDYDYCVIIGDAAGWSLETGDENVLIGKYAAMSLTSGDGKNVIIGANACGILYADHTYAENVVVGWEAGYSMTTARQLVLLGYRAGYSVDTSDGHVFIGHQAGHGYNSVYLGNICIGYQAGFAHGGSHAILIGYQAGQALTATATENVVIGEWAAEEATELQTSVLIGGYAGADLSTEYHNTFVGYAAGSKAGYGAGGTAIYNTYIGAGAGKGTGANNVCVGVYAGEGVITTSTYSFSVIVGSGAGQALLTGDSNVFMGYQAGKQATTAYEAVLIGYKAGFTLDSTGGNLCIGNLAGYNIGINDDCVYIGEHAGRNIDDGGANVAVGPGALEGADTSLVSGVGNTTAIGYYTLSNIKTGYRNDAHGHCSQFSNEDGYDNVAVGYYSLYYNVTGINNVAVGASAGRGVTGQSFSNNTLIGHHAGYALSSGGSNVFLGYLAGSTETTGSNKLYIENSASAAPLIYGEFDNDILRINAATAETNTIHETLYLRHQTSGTVAAGFGNSFVFELEDDAGTVREAAYLEADWESPATAAFKGAFTIKVADSGGTREGLKIRGSGSAVEIGFFGTAPAAKPSAYTPSNVTSDKTFDANATTLDELADVLGTLVADLQNLGLIG